VAVYPPTSGWFKPPSPSVSVSRRRRRVTHLSKNVMAY
jgi:hypothetical protein